VVALLHAALLGCAGCARSDDDIQKDVAAQMATDPATSGLHISVDVRRRIVFLSGMTNTVDEQQRALDVTRSVRGVKLVVNDIVLNEAALANQVKQALAADPLLATVPFDIEAQDGVVRLISDATNREQRERAVQITSAIAGVRDVEDRMK
jgi:osmotically-inducible protein OsmY